jgi:hypothetical protein
MKEKVGNGIWRRSFFKTIQMNVRVQFYSIATEAFILSSEQAKQCEMVRRLSSFFNQTLD